MHFLFRTLKNLFLFVLLFCFVNRVAAQFKVVGYVPVSRYFRPNLNAIHFKQLTHIDLAFINPDSSGSFAVIPHLDSLVMMAHDSGVKVLASIGGGNSPVILKQLLTAGNRKNFIDSILNYLVVNNLDGEDIDLEGDAVDLNYAAFVNELRPRLKSKGKLLTAAVATYYADKISNSTLKQFDFINVMSYDYTGPWTPKQPGQHSTYNNAVSDLNFFISKRGITKNKVVLGVPFYGYRFSKDTIIGLGFKSIIGGHPKAINNDTLNIADSGIVYYNGSSTINKKVRLALDKAGGVMIWQLYQDADAENSLLDIIDREITRQKIKRSKKV